MNTVIVTGGSGYIGSAICSYLIKSAKYKVINIDIDLPQDQLIEGSKDYLYIPADLTSQYTSELLRKINTFAKGGGVLGIIHMAAWKDLPASYDCPNEYYHNNLVSTINVLNLATDLNVKRFIFSSTAGVYGDDCKGAIQEFENVNPSSPYGKSKLMCEKIIEDVTKVNKFTSYCLRYQNPIGGIKGVTEDSSDSMFGNILNSIRYQRTFTIFGGDYDTEDGTCIRDYIDIRDIAVIHAFFLECKPIRQFDVINVGRGEPLSCLQACKIVKELYPSFEYHIGSRREGDAPGSYADIAKLKSEYYFDDHLLLPMKETIENIIHLAKHDYD